MVARSTRAWIETSFSTIGKTFPLVARSTRAWIETINLFDGSRFPWSHALRVRGLKLLRCVFIQFF